MSFSKTCRAISLDGSTLRAKCKLNNSDSFHDSSIDLNNFIGNQDGSFVHPGSGWLDSATESHLRTTFSVQRISSRTIMLLLFSVL